MSKIKLFQNPVTWFIIMQIVLSQSHSYFFDHVLVNDFKSLSGFDLSSGTIFELTFALIPFYIFPLIVPIMTDIGGLIIYHIILSKLGKKSFLSYISASALIIILMYLVLTLIWLLIWWHNGFEIIPNGRGKHLFELLKPYKHLMIARQIFGNVLFYFLYSLFLWLTDKSKN